MARSRKSKETVLETIQKNLSVSTCVFFASLQGLTAKQATILRKDCRDKNTLCLMAKKTLYRKAFNTANITSIDFKKLAGEVAGIFSFDDEIKPAKVLDRFKKDNDKLQILCGIILKGKSDTALLNSDQIIELSRLRSREELLSSLVGTISNPLRGFVGVLCSPLRGFITVLNGVADNNK